MVLALPRSLLEKCRLAADNTAVCVESEDEAAVVDTCSGVGVDGGDYDDAYSDCILEGKVSVVHLVRNC